MPLNGTSYEPNCSAFQSDDFIYFMIITFATLGVCFFLGSIITMVIMKIKSPGPSEQYYTTYKVLEKILSKTDLQERHEAFLDACVEYSKKQVGKEPEFDREYGFGKSEEVYNHFIYMEYKRLEESGKAEEAGGMKAPEGEHAGTEPEYA
jgi:hypothetical protein